MRLRDKYLYFSRHNIYYFRVIVQIDLNGCYVKKEYRRSLKTRNPQLARYYGAAMRVCFEKEGITKGASRMKWTEIKEKLDKKLLQLIAEEKAKIERAGPCTIIEQQQWEASNLPYLQHELKQLSVKRQRNHHDQPLDLPQFVQETVDSTFGGYQSEPLEAFNSIDQYISACEAALQMLIELTKKKVHIHQEARSFHEQPLNSSLAPPLSPSPKKNTLVSTVTEAYCKEMVTGGNWTPKTEGEYRAQYQLFIDVTNDTPIESVDYLTARHFKSSLQALPAHMKKTPQYRNKTISELLATTLPKEHLLSITKVNQYLSRVSSLFKWAQRNGYIKSNPFTGLKIKEKESAILKRLPFEKDDLTKIFESKIYKEGNFKHPYYYWLPLMAIYTGARIEELCQLHIADIYKIEDLYVLDINSSNNKKVKTLSSKRVIPIHHKLVELGLIKLVQDLKGKGKTRLFPELKLLRDGYSQAASKWFSRHKKSIGITELKKTFHSFRHTAIQNLKDQYVAIEHIAAIVGHKDEQVTTGLYGKKYEPKTLLPIVEQLSYNIEVKPYSHYNK